MRVTFVTGNARKLDEARAILGASATISLTSRALDLPELQGEPLDVARAKARHAAALLNGPALVEDTSLSYDALNGLPGVYVKWFLEKTGHAGLVDLLAAHDDKRAVARCVLAYARGPSDEEPLTFVGGPRGGSSTRAGRGISGGTACSSRRDANRRTRRWTRRRRTRARTGIAR